jgi:pimeloyl-ACP methyl ester carboxylesterase
MPPRGEVFLPAQTRWSPPPPLQPEREGLAQLADTSLWFQDTGGPGDIIVLIHAWTGSYASWSYQQGIFAAAGYRIISYSMRGHYRSAAIDPDAPGTATADLRALLDHLGVQRAHIVGTAGGAVPALDFALAHPDRTISVTIASGHMSITDPDYLAISATMFPKGATGMTQSFREVGSSYRAGNLEGLAEWEKIVAVCWQGGSVRQQSETPNTFARIESDLRVPTLLITGDADLIMPPSRMRGVAPHMPDAELVIVAEAGHSLHWEQPEAFNHAVLDFISRHTESA